MPFGLCLRPICPSLREHDLLPAVQSAKPLILIVEDDAASAEALGFILRDWGAEVVHAACADDVDGALHQRVHELRFIIADFNLGAGPDGVTVVQRLKRGAPQLRALMLSGSFGTKAPNAAADAGLELMRKPARAEAILAWLERG